jgi:hypothetical protein
MTLGRRISLQPSKGILHFGNQNACKPTVLLKKPYIIDRGKSDIFFKRNGKHYSFDELERSFQEKISQSVANPCYPLNLQILDKKM